MLSNIHITTSSAPAVSNLLVVNAALPALRNIFIGLRFVSLTDYISFLSIYYGTDREVSTLGFSS